jgi:hypothetical protein
MRESQLSEAEKDIAEIHEEVKYIIDDQGRRQRVYDVSDFVDESKIITKPAKSSE